MNTISRASLRLPSLLLMTVVSVSLSVVSVQSFAQTRASTTPEYAPGEIIVKLRAKANSVEAAAFVGRAVTAHRMNLKTSYDNLNMHHFKLKQGQNLDDVINQLNQDPSVEFAEPNYIVHKQSETSQTSAHIELQQEWNNLTPGLAPVVVAIVDTGLDLSHPVFTSTGAVWVNAGEHPGNGIDDDQNGYVDDVNGYNFAAGTASPNDDEGHGTHVAGIVLGTSQDITAGSLSPAKIKIMPLKFLDSTGSGSTANAISAINYAVANGAKIISNSWGGGSPSDSLLQAIAYAYDHKVLFVAAAGNNGSNNDSTPTYPANYTVPNVISVAATTSNDVMATFSNFGVSSVSLSAPGVGIYSTYIGHSWATMSGTSMATPFVAGVAALMLRENSSMSAYQVRSVLLGAVDNVPGLAVSTHGRLNAYNSVVAAKSVVASAVQPAYAASADRSPSSDAGSGGCGRVQNTNEPIWHSFTDKGGPSSSQGIGVVLFIVIVTLPVALAVGLRAKSPQSKRKHDRFMINSEVKVKLGDRELVGQVSTISLGGLQLNADAMLEKGGMVSMVITGPDGKEQIQVEGRVVWSEEQKHYGVQFDNAEKSVLNSISGWTRNLIKAS